MSRLKGGIKRFEAKYEPTDIGFVDEHAYFLAQSFFVENDFIEWSVFSPREDSTRRFLTVGYGSTEPDLVYVHAVPDKFHSPSHSDYMGALMSLQIDRKLFGDIIVTDSSDAYFVVWNKGDVVSHLIDSFVSCGRAKLSLELTDADKFSSLVLQFDELDLLVTSLRVDCIISAIANTSRTQAKNVVASGDFKLFSSPVTDCDYQLRVGDIFSLRGFGKYRFDGIIGTTRRDRLRIALSKFGKYIERNRCHDCTSRIKE